MLGILFFSYNCSYWSLPIISSSNIVLVVYRDSLKLDDPIASELTAAYVIFIVHKLPIYKQIFGKRTGMHLHVASLLVKIK